jgi:hypothetical protein
MNRFVSIAVLATLAGTAHAGESYASLGTTGVLLGYGQPLNDRVKLRVDLSTLGSHRDNFTEEGIAYEGRLKAHRLGLFADYFPGSGGWRLTGGVTVNDYRVDATGRGSGGTITIGGTVYPVTADDRFDVTVKLPSVTPYLGIGYGIAPSRASGRGWGANFDLGAMFGRPKVSGSVSGPVLGAAVTQADIDRELAEIRESSDDFRVFPQFSFGISYRY